VAETVWKQYETVRKERYRKTARNSERQCEILKIKQNGENRKSREINGMIFVIRDDRVIGDEQGSSCYRQLY